MRGDRLVSPYLNLVIAPSSHKLPLCSGRRGNGGLYQASGGSSWSPGNAVAADRVRGEDLGIPRAILSEFKD